MQRVIKSKSIECMIKVKITKTVLTIIGILFTATLISLVITNVAKDDSSIESLINNYTKADISESEKEKIRTAAEKITNPDTAEDYFLKGHAADIDGNFEEALEHYLKAIDVNPEHVKTYKNLGNIFLNAGDLDEAIKYTGKALELEQELQTPVHMANTRILLALAVLFFLFIVVFSLPKTEAVISKYSGIVISYIQQFFAIQKVKKDIEDQVVDEYEYELKYDKTFISSVNNVDDEGKYQVAIQTFQNEIKLHRDQAGAYINLAAAQVDSGKYLEAIHSFQRAIDIEHDNPYAHKNIGLAYEKLSNQAKVKANDCYQKSETLKKEKNLIMNHPSSIKNHPS